MNPVDHPHGGGEGKTSGGRHPVHALGQADQGATRRGRTSRPTSSSSSGAESKEKGLDVARSIKKGPFIDDHLARR